MTSSGNVSRCSSARRLKDTEPSRACHVASISNSDFPICCATRVETRPSSSPSPPQDEAIMSTIKPMSSEFLKMDSKSLHGMGSLPPEFAAMAESFRAARMDDSEVMALSPFCKLVQDRQCAFMLAEMLVLRDSLIGSDALIARCDANFSPSMLHNVFALDGLASFAEPWVASSPTSDTATQHFDSQATYHKSISTHQIPGCRAPFSSARAGARCQGPISKACWQRRPSPTGSLSSIGTHNSTRLDAWRVSQAALFLLRASTWCFR